MQPETKQARIADSILAEIEQEAVTTKKLLELLPEDKLTWRPHSKAMSLGELAMHVAGLQGGVAELSSSDSADAADLPPLQEAKSRTEVLEVFADSQRKAKEIVGSTDDERAMSEWQFNRDGKTVVAMPRIAFWRSILLNHNYHHRGQLSTYLRQLDVKLPSIYGPSADENPFG